MKLYAENLCEGQKYQYIFKTKGGIRKKNAKLLETSLLKNYGKLSSLPPRYFEVYSKKVVTEKHRFAASKKA